MEASHGAGHSRAVRNISETHLSQPMQPQNHFPRDVNVVFGEGPLSCTRPGANHFSLFSYKMQKGQLCTPKP